MLRITPINDTPQLILKVEGRLVGSDVALLASQGHPLLNTPQHLEIDLAAIQQIDATGWNLLNQWQRRGVVLRGGTPYIDHLLARLAGLPKNPT